MDKRLLTITVHVAAWACFFLLPIVFSPQGREPNFQFSDAYIKMSVCLDIFLLLFYYSNFYFLIPRFLSRQQWLWYILAVIACFILFAGIHKYFDDAMQLEMPARWRFKKEFHQHFLFYPFRGPYAVFFLVFTVSTCVRVIQEYLGIEKKQQQVETEKLATELSFLKLQINPHFLFNTLNNIYSLAVVKSDATAMAVLKLSSIMRYVLSETQHDLVPLEKEIEFIGHYIELQKIRITDKVRIEFLTEGEIGNKQIAPLILIPFVENAFKYGISAKENAEILFFLRADAERIYFTCENTIATAAKDSHEQNGIGLKNTWRRLELLYPGRHSLSVSQENNRFIIQLTLT